MRIASFDIGIKNLAVCILELEEEESQNIKIIQWNVFNLLENEKAAKGVITQCMFSSKTKTYNTSPSRVTRRGTRSP